MKDTWTDPIKDEPIEEPDLSNCTPDAEQIARGLYVVARELRGIRRSLRNISVDLEDEPAKIRDHVHTIAVAVEALEGRG